MIYFFYSDSENSSDSLELIDPVTNLSLEHIDKTKSFKDLDEFRFICFLIKNKIFLFSQSKKLEKLYLSGSKKIITKKINQIVIIHIFNRIFFYLSFFSNYFLFNLETKTKHEVR